jgi:glycosyltransferase involved in cell wall biosynthesis
MYLAQEWVKLGHRVTIIVASYSHLFLTMPSFAGSHAVEMENGIQYYLLKTPRYAGNGIARIINMFAFAFRLWQLGRMLSQRLRPHIVIAGSTHGLDFLFARRIAWLSGGTIVREVRDLWPLTLTDLGGYAPSNPLVMLFKAAENVSYRTADKLITTLPASLGYMQERGLSPEKWKYIPQGVDLNPQESVELPAEIRTVLVQLREEGRFLVGYAGSHGIANGLDVFVDAASLLRDTRAAFVLIGQGGEKERLKKRGGELGLTNMFFLPAIPKKCVQGFLSLVSVALIVWRKKPLYRYGVSPNKLMDYMLAAKPIIHAVEASNDMVAQADCGITVPPEDPPALAHAVRQLMLMTPEALEGMGQRGSVFVRTNNDYRILAQHYLDFVRQ